MAVRIHDLLLAKTLDVGSAIGPALPTLGAAVGKKEAPSQLRARWRSAGYDSRTVKNWQEFPGHEASGWTPLNYRLAALISIDKEFLDHYQGDVEGYQAVIYALRTAVMVGTVDQPNFLGDDPENPDRYAVGVLFDKRVLQLAFAVRNQIGNTFDLSAETTKGPVLPLDTWPAAVPLLRVPA